MCLRRAGLQAGIFLVTLTNDPRPKGSTSPSSTIRQCSKCQWSIWGSVMSRLVSERAASERKKHCKDLLATMLKQVDTSQVTGNECGWDLSFTMRQPGTASSLEGTQELQISAFHHSCSATLVNRFCSSLTLSALSNSPLRGGVLRGVGHRTPTTALGARSPLSPSWSMYDHNRSTATIRRLL